MKLLSLSVRGLRSLHDVTLAGLGERNVLYGANGAGKSNVLMAVSWLRALLLGQNPCGPDDLAHGAAACELTAEVALSDLPPRWEGFTRAELGWRIDRGERTQTVLRLHGEQVYDLCDGSNRWHSRRPRLELDVLYRAIADRIHLVPAIRGVPTGEAGVDVLALLRDGRLADALFRAQSSPDWRLRRRLRDLQALLTGPPLARPPFVATQHPDGRCELREELPGGDGRDVPLDMAGLGLVQVYTILAQMLLSGASILLLEEPEAHLHAPTTGRQLRALLDRLLTEHGVQVFVATHSNLFDLDPDGYWDVRLEPGRGTVVERRPLDDLDGRHLYEPGPARRAISSAS